MAYGDFKHLPRRTASNKALHDKAFNTTKNPNYDGYQTGLVSMVFSCFFWWCYYTISIITWRITQTNYLKIWKWKVYSSFKDNTWGADLVDMQLISKFNRENYFLLCINNIYGKSAWVVPLKDEKKVL